MKFWFQNSPYFPSYVKNWPSYGTKRKDNFNIGPAFTHFYLLKMKLHNPVCLTFCVVTWSIFHVGRKVRWVLKSKFCGLYNGYQKFLCTCSRTRENNENKVKTDLWDTLYILLEICIVSTINEQLLSTIQLTLLSSCHSLLCGEIVSACALLARNSAASTSMKIFWNWQTSTFSTRDGRYPLHKNNSLSLDAYINTQESQGCQYHHN